MRESQLKLDMDHLHSKTNWCMRSPKGRTCNAEKFDNSIDFSSSPGQGTTRQKKIGVQYYILNKCEE